jgi:glycosyltransferase involved in cell wall biosynthesis
MFETGNADDLAQNLIALISSPENQRSLADAAHAVAHEKFSIETHIRALSHLYREILTK